MSKVLVADGDPERRARLTNLLRQAGHDATAVDNGTDALQVLRAGPCCLAVLDLELPGVGGLDLLREARAEGDRPVILIGPDCPESRRAAVLLGVDRYLVRPVAEALLLVAVRAVLRDCPDS